MIWVLLPVVIPVLGGISLWFLNRDDRRLMMAVTGAVSVINAALVWHAVLSFGGETFTLISLGSGLDIAFKIDGLGFWFSIIFSTLWPITTFYAFEYMEKDVFKTGFFQFYLMSFGATAGIAFSANLLTMYCFYEMLTLATTPLVLHPMTRAAVKATRVYLVFSIGGAALGMMGIVFLLCGGSDLVFAYGGTVAAVSSVYMAVYVMMFVGFSVKSAVFPSWRWLPMASVAPTPVTALLHAVAVVKAGAFAVMRLTWYVFDCSYLIGTWAQYIPMALAIFTILFGSVMALRQGHLKLRLAYSTVSNLSYIMFGTLLMTPAGLSGGLLHMMSHALMKILAFFCAGAVLHKTGKEFICDLDGYGKKMPLTFACFAVSAAAKTGVPPLCGFISKWYLLTASAEAGGVVAYIGAFAIIFAALLTAIYMFTIVIHVFFHRSGADTGKLSTASEAGALMTLPMQIVAALCILTGLFADPIVSLADSIASGVFMGGQI